MKKLSIILALCLMLSALVGCGETDAEKSESESSSASSFEAAPITAVEKEIDTEKETDLSEMTPDPPYDFNIDEMVPADFGDFFDKSYECEIETYKLLPGDTYENEVTVIKGENDGPTVYVIAGVHGDEEAAWQTGKLLKKIDIKAGTLYILGPANPWGAAKLPKSRYLDGKDLNRSFPGDKDGNSAERVAYAIYNDVKDKNPDFVFDLHEAVVVEADRDYLGSSLIFTRLELFEDMFMDLLAATESGEICSMPFSYYGPGPDGSVNNTISTNLSIPVLTVETFRGYQMDVRISDQLDVVQYVLKYYGMV